MNMISPITPAIETIDPVDTREAGKWPLWKRVSAILLPLATVGGGVLWMGRDAPAIAAPAPPSVTVAAPITREITEWDEHVGRFEASQSVEVRPRVSGAITGIHFEDGAMVRKGQLLFTIDARPFVAALAEAQAGVAQARSDAILADTDFERAGRLLAEDAVSRSDYDRLSARVRAARAGLAAAQARVQARELDVQFTQIRSPISGRISDRRIDTGNLVAAGDAAGGTLLTTINALDPIHFTFDTSEALYLKTQRERARSGSGGQRVEIRLQDEADYSRLGRVDFTDNGISAQSGTIRARAVVANPDNFLAPGMFGNMRLTGGAPERAMLIPDAAVRTDQARKIVYVVVNDAIEVKPVTVGPRIGRLRSIRSGLDAGDKVVIQGLQMVQPGAKVSPRLGRINPPEQATSVAAAPAQSPVSAQATLASN